ncbi:MAG: RNA-binding protein [SAR202 cluster bacterium]|nr:RNA-binding protein [SAR202 cluster bacterium]|tara:strand:+ start:1436 stop:1696 length:261 start_codon:yes stop_codon:yes gene_type:complete
MRIYVGNLSWQTDENELRETFAPHGEVVSAQIITDRESGRSRGFGFVEMENDEEAKAAIDAVNGNEVGGRQLKVNEAKPRSEKPRY